MMEKEQSRWERKLNDCGALRPFASVSFMHTENVYCVAVFLLLRSMVSEMSQNIENLIVFNLRSGRA